MNGRDREVIEHLIGVIQESTAVKGSGDGDDVKVDLSGHPIVTQAKSILGIIEREGAIKVREEGHSNLPKIALFLSLPLPLSSLSMHATTACRLSSPTLGRFTEGC